MTTLKPEIEILELDGCREPTVLDQIVESAEAARRDEARLDGVVVIARLEGFDEGGRPLVGFEGLHHGGAIPARATVSLTTSDIGRGVALMFEAGDPRRPIALGVVRDPVAGRDSATVMRDPSPEHGPESLVLEAARDIVLRCGKASITLTRAGKILLRGAYLLSRSSGVNRIKGGSIELN